MPKFLLKFNAAVIKEIPLEKTPLTIGRKTDNDIVIDNLSVSSHHARIILQGNSYVIEDLNSTNGTFLNDKKIISSVLRHRDKILIGQHTLEFINPEESIQDKEQINPQTKDKDLEATVVIEPQKINELQKTSNMKEKTNSEMVGVLKLVEGKSDKTEYYLSNLLTYIGKSETANIKLKGLFSPDIAALISKRPQGYIITAVKDGYPKLNNKSIQGQVELKDGDIIEVGSLKFIFQMKEYKPE